MTDMSDVPIADENRSAWLDDVGAPGHLAAFVVTPSGEEYLVVMNTRKPSGVRCDRTCRAVAHEQLGPLPAAWMRRVYGDEVPR